MRTAFDFSPLYRNTVGFDRFASLLDSAAQSSNNSTNYPPYDIESTGENTYAITIAAAGFTEDELNITSENGTLVVKGKKEKTDEERKYLHQGIAFRSFERKFQLADHVEVTGANLQNGLLRIDLLKELPEAMKPKKIAINSNRVLEQKA
ncbi:Hsp20 family protein [Reinekea marina]|uniref:Hsp20 family protein n=1 Tax=Reinekea marina TaxID=1310421 RepID=A0ABV7WRR7_9GAMM|nr:Hsp20 family protein [Reinekea marina]MBU2864830.1 Hsp20 family protein [Reinekea forsetii]MDN3648591.1 Hsp20 family protein [Reinekea marina]